MSAPGENLGQLAQQCGSGARKGCANRAGGAPTAALEAVDWLPKDQLARGWNRASAEKPNSLTTTHGSEVLHRVRGNAGQLRTAVGGFRWLDG
jgi:hypothetical protein